MTEWMKQNPMPVEVEWYRKHGRYPERIAMSRPTTVYMRGGKFKRYAAEPYVIGDWSWNRVDSRHEEIEPRMYRAGLYL